MKIGKPKRRAIIHLLAKQKTGAGVHRVTPKAGPSTDDWDEPWKLRSADTRKVFGSCRNCEDPILYDPLDFGSGEIFERSLARVLEQAHICHRCFWSAYWEIPKVLEPVSTFQCYESNEGVISAWCVWLVWSYFDYD
jgi:hypothetical protein